MNKKTIDTPVFRGLLTDWWAKAASEDHDAAASALRVLIQHIDHGGAAVRGEAVAEALKDARAFIENNSNEVGYGFYRPANPNDFHPDAESCSVEEIAAHKAACEAYDKGEFMPNNDSGWVSPTMHILTAPWGIGSYSYRSPDAQEMLAKIDAALSARAADAPSERSELAETIRQLRNIASEDVTPYFCTNVPKDLLRRAADALDSQPTESPDAEYVLDGYYRKNGKHFDKLRGHPNSCTLDSGWVAHYVRVEVSSQPTEPDGCAKCRHTYCMSGEVCKACGDVAMQGWKGGRQPTDGGVRNG